MLTIKEFLANNPNYVKATISDTPHLVPIPLFSGCMKNTNVKYKTYTINNNNVGYPVVQTLVNAKLEDEPSSCAGVVIDNPGMYKTDGTCLYKCIGNINQNKKCCCDKTAIENVPCNLRPATACDSTSIKGTLHLVNSGPNFSYQDTASGPEPTSCSTTLKNCIVLKNQCNINSKCALGLPYGTPLYGAWWYLYGCLYGGGTNPGGSVLPGNKFQDYIDKAKGNHNSTWYLDNGSVKAYGYDGSFADFNCPTNKFSGTYLGPKGADDTEVIDTTNNTEIVFNLGGWGSCCHTASTCGGYPPPDTAPNNSYCFYTKRKNSSGKYVDNITTYGKNIKCGGGSTTKIPSQKGAFPKQYQTLITPQHLCGMAKTENPCQGGNEVWVDEYLTNIMKSPTTYTSATPDNLATSGYTAISLDIEAVGKSDWTQEDINAIGAGNLLGGILTSATLKKFLTTYKSKGIKRILTLPGWGVGDYNGGMSWFKDLIPSTPGTNDGDYEHICLMMYSKINDSETQIYVEEDGSSPYAKFMKQGSKPYSLLEDAINIIWLNKTDNLHVPLQDGPFLNNNGKRISETWYPNIDLKPEHIILGLTFGTTLGLNNLFQSGSQVTTLAKGGITVWAYPLQRGEVISYYGGCAKITNASAPQIEPPTGEGADLLSSENGSSGQGSSSFSYSTNIHKQ